MSFEHNFSARIAIQNSELSPSRSILRLAARSACVETLNSTDIERCNLRGIETPNIFGAATTMCASTSSFEAASGRPRAEIVRCRDELLPRRATIDAALEGLVAYEFGPRLCPWLVGVLA